MKGQLLALAVIIGAFPPLGGTTAVPITTLQIARAEYRPNAAVRLRSDREVIIPSGTPLHVRLENSVGSDLSRVEDPVRARLVNPVVIDGRTVLPAGSSVLGSVTEARRSGKVKGRGQLAVRFAEVTRAGDNERYRMRTRTWARVAPATKMKDAATIALPAAGGAIVGGLIGGEKGAAIGAAAGGGTGTAVVLTTRGKEVRLGRGTMLTIRLSAPLSVHVT